MEENPPCPSVFGQTQLKKMQELSTSVSYLVSLLAKDPLHTPDEGEADRAAGRLLIHLNKSSRVLDTLSSGTSGFVLKRFG